MDFSKLVTYLGWAKGILIASIDFTLHAMSAEGFTFASPVFWMGLLWAMIDIVKSIFTQGVTKAPGT